MLNQYLSSSKRLSKWRHTISHPIVWSGRGVHSGKSVEVRAFPYHPLPDEPLGVILNGYPLSEWSLSHHTLSTGIQHSLGGEIRMTEHLFAALACAGVDDLILDCRPQRTTDLHSLIELPMLDGSAAEYIQPLSAVRTQLLETDPRSSKRHPLIIQETLTIEHDQAQLIITPNVNQSCYSTTACSIEWIFDYPPLPIQHLRYDGSDHELALILQARTFGFLADEQRLRKEGLIRGVTNSNTTIYDQYGRAINQTIVPLEAARHKTLDLIGDLFLLGKPLVGRVYVNKGGHMINHLLIEALQSSVESVS